MLEFDHSVRYFILHFDHSVRYFMLQFDHSVRYFMLQFDHSVRYFMLQFDHSVRYFMLQFDHSVRYFKPLKSKCLLFCINYIDIKMVCPFKSVPIPKINERDNHKWCNLWRINRVYISGHANQ